MADYDPDAPIPHFYFPDSELQELSEIAHPLADAEYPSPLQFFNGKKFEEGLKDYNEFREQHGSAVGDAQPEPTVLSFFNGRPYPDGLKAYNDYQTSTSSKGAK